MSGERRTIVRRGSLREASRVQYVPNFVWNVFHARSSRRSDY